MYKSRRLNVHVIVYCSIRRRCHHFDNSNTDNNSYSWNNNMHSKIHRSGKDKKTWKKRNSSSSNVNYIRWCTKANPFYHPIAFSLTFSCNMTPWQDTWIPICCKCSTWQCIHCSSNKSTWRCSWRVSEVHKGQVPSIRTLPYCPMRRIIKYTTTWMMKKLSTCIVML